MLLGKQKQMLIIQESFKSTPIFDSNLIEELEKAGGTAYIGEIRTWKDGRYLRMQEGWKKLPEHLQSLNKATKEIMDILKSEASSSVQLEKLMKIGINDVESLVSLTQEDASKVVQKTLNSSSSLNTVTQKTLTSSVLTSPSQPKIKIDAEKRWKTYEVFSRIVIDGKKKGMIAYGTGGVGKTFTLNELIKKSTNPITNRSLREYDEELNPTPSEYDYVKITGKATPPALFRALYEHNKKLIVFDDCDAVLEDIQSINILKGAIDTSGDGTITYATSSPMKDKDGEKLPMRFKFRGKIIFISNIPQEKVLKDPQLQALLSRTFPVDLTMDKKETLERLNVIKDKMPFENNLGEEIEVSKEDRQAAVDFLTKNIDQLNISKLNARTLGSVALVKQEIDKSPDLYSGLTWEEAALSIIS